MLAILLFVGCAKPTNTEPIISPVEEQQVKVIVNKEQLKESEGQVVQIEGITQRMKAGSSILFDDIEIWCLGMDWEDSGKQVRVIGVLSRGGSPQSSFPIATQDENGGWSQGVRGDSSMVNTELESLRPDDSPTTKPSSESPKPTSSADWLLTVEKHSWLK